MKAYEYEAVIFNDEIFCLECLPVETSENNYCPIFADSEWNTYPICSECGTEHDYVNLISDKEMTYYCIMKNSRWSENPSPYSGSCCNNAKIIPTYYKNKFEAEHDAKILSEWNPVGFSVVKANKLHPDFPIK